MPLRIACRPGQGPATLAFQVAAVAPQFQFEYIQSTDTDMRENRSSQYKSHDSMYCSKKLG
jgi:hypothetical protein